MSRPLSLALWLGCASAAACAPALPSPESTARAYANAALAKDARAAYALMSARFRGQVPFDKFEPGLEAFAPTTTARLRDATVEWRAVADEDGAAELRLVREDEAWRLDVDPTLVYPQGTARETIRGFARAIARGRLERAAALLCTALRKSLTPAALAERLSAASPRGVSGIAEEVRAHLEDLTTDGDSVRVPLGPVTELQLRREPGGWCVAGLP